MTTKIVRRIDSTIMPTQHPYMTGAWTPLHEEVDADELEVIGEIPSDLSGVYIRNTENPVHQPIGLYHPFDGDGMVHAMSFRNGKASYRNRFVRTRGFLAEQEQRRALWAGIAEDPRRSTRPGWGAHGGVKDSSSTDVVVHAGRILSTFYQCGEGYRLDPYSLDTEGVADWTPAEGVSAHPKVDPETGELLFFNYSTKPPFMHYGVVGADDRLKHMTAIPLPGSRLPHDMAFTKNYSILADLPLFWDEKLLAQGRHAARFHKSMPTRFAILPRYGSQNEIKWFDAAPTYVLHWMNAWEEGEEIILDGYFQEDPQPRPLAAPDPAFGQMMAYLDQHSMKPKLHRWRFNLRTGKTHEEHLDERILEFGTFNPAWSGRASRHIYSTTAKPGWFLFTGMVKHDTQTGDSTEISFGEDRYGSEAPFAARPNAASEDDGYLISFVTDMKTDRSECVVIDAKDFAAGPVCRIMLPHRISSGTHAAFASHEEIARGRAAARSIAA